LEFAAAGAIELATGGCESELQCVATCGTVCVAACVAEYCVAATGGGLVFVGSGGDSMLQCVAELLQSVAVCVADCCVATADGRVSTRGSRDTVLLCVAVRVAVHVAVHVAVCVTEGSGATEAGRGVEGQVGSWVSTEFARGASEFVDGAAEGAGCGAEKQVSSCDSTTEFVGSSSTFVWGSSEFVNGATECAEKQVRS